MATTGPVGVRHICPNQKCFCNNIIQNFRPPLCRSLEEFLPHDDEGSEYRSIELCSEESFDLQRRYDEPNRISDFDEGGLLSSLRHNSSESQLDLLDDGSRSSIETLADFDQIDSIQDFDTIGSLVHSAFPHFKKSSLKHNHTVRSDSISHEGTRHVTIRSRPDDVVLFNASDRPSEVCRRVTMKRRLRWRLRSWRRALVHGLNLVDDGNPTEQQEEPSLCGRLFSKFFCDDQPSDGCL